MERQELEEGARKILLTNLRRGVADWNSKEYSFVCPALVGYPFQWFWDSCFHAIALIYLDKEQAKAELTTLMSAALPDGFIPHLIFCLVKAATRQRVSLQRSEPGRSFNQAGGREAASHLLGAPG